MFLCWVHSALTKRLWLLVWAHLWSLYIYIYVVPFDKALYLHCLGLPSCIWLRVRLMSHPGVVNERMTLIRLKQNYMKCWSGDKQRPREKGFLKSCLHGFKQKILMCLKKPSKMISTHLNPSYKRCISLDCRGHLPCCYSVPTTLMSCKCTYSLL